MGHLGRHFRGAVLSGDGIVSFAKQATLTNVGVNWSAISVEQGSIATGAMRVQSGDILLACAAHEIAYVGRKVNLETAA